MLDEGTKITVKKARLNGRQGYFIGLPGQVQQIEDGVATVMCGDGVCLDLLDWDSDRRINRHSMLGTRP